MSPGYTSLEWEEYGFPRVSGDEPRLTNFLNTHTTFSPRERG